MLVEPMGSITKKQHIPLETRRAWSYVTQKDKLSLEDRAVQRPIIKLYTIIGNR